MEQENDTWIFLSHSNKDYDLVKTVRNRLEEHNRRPIMFFLKCLDDHAEVWELIKREIDARSRFVLCKSRHTEDPDGWVQKEFNYIKEQSKPYEVVDLNSPELLDGSIKRLVKRSKVYILHSKDNSSFAALLKNELQKNSFEATDWEELCIEYFQLPGNADWGLLYDKMIEIYAKDGYVLCLWSQPLTNSQKTEFEKAARNVGKEGFIIPFVTDKAAYTDWEFYNECRDSYGIRVNEAVDGADSERVNRIVSRLKVLDNIKNAE